MSDYKDIKRIQSEALIEAVRREPCLYDYSSKLYRNKPHKNRLWAQIAARTGFLDWKTANDRWVNLRNQYGKLHKTTRQSAENGLHDDQPHWPYYEALGFLEPHLKERTSHTISFTQEQSPLNDCYDMFDSNHNSTDPAIERLKHIQTNVEHNVVHGDRIKTSPDGGVENCNSSSTAKYPPELSQPSTTSFSYYEHEQKKAKIQVEPHTEESLPSYLNKEKTEGDLFGKAVGMRLDRMEPRKSALARIEIEKILFKFEFD